MKYASQYAWNISFTTQIPNRQPINYTCSRSSKLEPSSPFRKQKMFHPTKTIEFGAPQRAISRVPTMIVANIDHVALSCHQSTLEVAQWYCDVLGFAPINFEDFESGKKCFPMVRLSTNSILVFMPAPSSSTEDEDNTSFNEQSQYNHICLCVTKQYLDAIVNRLKAHNIEYTDHGKRLLAARGRARGIFFPDVDGNTIEILHYD